MEVTMTTSIFSEDDIKNLKRVGVRIGSMGLKGVAFVASTYKTMFEIQSDLLGFGSYVCGKLERAFEVTSDSLEDYSDSL